MKLSIFVAGALLLVSQFASADILTLTPGTQTLDGVTVASGGTLTLPSGPVTLTTATYGLRQKQVAVVNVKVYVLTVLSSDASAYQKSSIGAALTSLDGMQANALRLDFVYAVSASTVESSFADAFSANNVDTSRPAIQNFLSAVSSGGAAASGKALTIAFDEKNNQILYQDNSGNVTTVAGDSTLLNDVLAIWFGVPADSGLQTLQTALLGN